MEKKFDDLEHKEKSTVSDTDERSKVSEFMDILKKNSNEKTPHLQIKLEWLMMISIFNFKKNMTRNSEYLCRKMMNLSLKFIEAEVKPENKILTHLETYMILFFIRQVYLEDGLGMLE